jgi:AcrR family transcriptional regulator
MRKAPTQARAKERVERILDATERLIIADGVAALTVNNIASEAKVPIGSLYQYFTNRDEVLRALCDRYYRTLGEAASDCFRNVRTVAEFNRHVRQALITCWNFTRDNPGYRQLFFDVQAWEIMREADWQDTFLNAKRMGEALQQLVPYISEKRILALCVIVGDAASGTARLAARLPELREELFAEFIEMVESRVYSLLRDNAAVEHQADRAPPPARASISHDGTTALASAGTAGSGGR